MTTYTATFEETSFLPVRQYEVSTLDSLMRVIRVEKKKRIIRPNGYAVQNRTRRRNADKRRSRGRSAVQHKQKQPCFTGRNQQAEHRSRIS